MKSIDILLGSGRGPGAFGSCNTGATHDGSPDRHGAVFFRAGRLRTRAAHASTLERRAARFVSDCAAMSYEYDAVVVGSGPNGLAAAVAIARAGHSVLVVEAREAVGGGLHSAAITRPGFLHDVCSAVHPLGVLSPWFRSLPLQEHGLTWVHPKISAAHPLSDGRAVVLARSLADTAAQLGADEKAYRRMFEPFLREPAHLLRDLLGPLGIPTRPLAFARFGLRGMRSALGLARGAFRGEEARALFAGCAAHAILPLDKWFTAAVGMLFLLTGHMEDWPMVQGGSVNLARALAAYFESLGGVIRTGAPVSRLSELPNARAYLFDLAPRQVIEIAGEQLPVGYRRRLARYNYGPAVFKIDYALAGPIPWRAEVCAGASTVHVGGSMAEIARSEHAAFHGEIAAEPFVMVCQQSHFDPSRAPAGQHTGYAYCHVPHASPVDMTEALERQIDRFAPGFRDLILERRAWFPADIERDNASCVGGVIAGGASDITQLLTRPIARLNPYTTPNPRLFLCGASTPPGGGVHGMCGYYAARTVLRRWHGHRTANAMTQLAQRDS
jgi:phytoene dehydrogenase-like protein